MLILGEVYERSEDSLDEDSDSRYFDACSRSNIHGGSFHSRISNSAIGAVWHGNAHNRIWARNIRVRLCNQTASETRRNTSAAASTFTVKKALEANLAEQRFYVYV
jgi:hypothetical protein